MIRKIVSGGQSGVDRAALDVAIHLGIEHGGWCPRGRRAEDGRIASIYRLQETESSNYAERTEKNVLDSDGTLILYLGLLAGGTLLTLHLAQRWNKPFFVLDLASQESGLHSAPDDARPSFDRWVCEHNIETLNVAGPRESSMPGISQIARAHLFSLFDEFRAPDHEVELEDV